MSLARGVIGVAGWVLLAMTVVSGGLGLWLVRDAARRVRQR